MIENPKLKKAQKWFGTAAIVVAVIATLLRFLPKFPTGSLENITFFQSSQKVMEQSMRSERETSQNGCSGRYGSSSFSAARRIKVNLPIDGKLSEEVTFTGSPGKCYWFKGPEGTEVWFDDGTHGTIHKYYPPKNPKIRFSNPSGGTVTIVIER